MRLHSTNFTRSSIAGLTAGLVALVAAASACSSASAEQEHSVAFADPSPLVVDASSTIVDPTDAATDAAIVDTAVVDADKSEVLEAAVVSLNAESGFVTERLFIDAGYATVEIALTTEWDSDGGERWVTVDTAAPGMPDDWAAELAQAALDVLPEVWAGDTSFGPGEVDDNRRQLLINLETILVEDGLKADIVGDKLVSLVLEVPFENTHSWYRWDSGPGKSPATRNS